LVAVYIVLFEAGQLIAIVGVGRANQLVDEAEVGEIRLDIDVIVELL
jgi:hypothetical protein